MCTKMLSKVGLTEQHGSGSMTLLRRVLPGLRTSNGDSTHGSLDVPHTVRTESWEQLSFLFWLWPLGNMTPFCKKTWSFWLFLLFLPLGWCFSTHQLYVCILVFFTINPLWTFCWDQCCHLNICCWLNSDIKFNFELLNVMVKVRAI